MCEEKKKEEKKKEGEKKRKEEQLNYLDLYIAVQPYPGLDGVIDLAGNTSYHSSAFSEFKTLVEVIRGNSSSANAVPYDWRLVCYGRRKRGAKRNEKRGKYKLSNLVTGAPRRSNEAVR